MNNLSHQVESTIFSNPSENLERITISGTKLNCKCGTITYAKSSEYYEIISITRGNCFQTKKLYNGICIERACEFDNIEKTCIEEYNNIDFKSCKTISYCNKKKLRNVFLIGHIVIASFVVLVCLGCRCPIRKLKRKVSICSLSFQSAYTCCFF